MFQMIYFFIKIKTIYYGLLLNGSIFNLNNNIFVCLTYVLPDDSSRQSMVETNIFDRLLQSLSFIENINPNECLILLCGDINSRTSTKVDYVVDDNNVHMHIVYSKPEPSIAMF